MAAKESEITPETIKNRFLSFISSVKDKSGLKVQNLLASKQKDIGDTSNGDVNHEEKTEPERQITDPRDRKSYFNRVETYTPLTWFAKPKDLSPLECSRFGWKNTDVDMLECVSCKAKLCGQLPEVQDLEVYQEFYQKLKENVKSSHEKCCSWSSNPSPVSFTEVEFYDKKEVMNQFKNRLKGLQSLELSLPRLSYKSFTEKGFGIDRLNSLVTEFKDSLTEQDRGDMQLKDTCILTSLLLAACGWKISETSSSVLTCFYCKRNVGLWNYQKEQSEHSKNQDNNTDLGPKTNNNGEDNDMPSKRFKLEEKDSFDPIEEHRYWCPWIKETTAKSRQKSSIESSPGKNPANQSVELSSEPCDIMDTAWIQMLFYVFPSLDSSHNQDTSMTQYFRQKSPVPALRKMRKLLSDWSSPHVHKNLDKQ